MKIGIYYNEEQVDGKEVQALSQLLAEKGTRPVLFRRTEQLANGGIDRLIVLGGDGTVLRAARTVPEIPIVGINFGTLGFLTEFERDELQTAAEFVLDQSCETLCRAMLEIEFKGERSFCLNELSLFHRASEQSRGIAKITVNIDGNPAGAYSADGIIVSTPTGSTAYSLSAGGCIMTPDCETFLITPVCAFSLRSRPVVYSAKSTLSLSFSDAEMAVLEDGIFVGKTGKDDVITVRQAKRKAVFLTRDKSAFFRKLAGKIN